MSFIGPNPAIISTPFWWWWSLFGIVKRWHFIIVEELYSRYLPSTISMPRDAISIMARRMSFYNFYISIFPQILQINVQQINEIIIAPVAGWANFAETPLAELCRHGAYFATISLPILAAAYQAHFKMLYYSGLCRTGELLSALNIYVKSIRDGRLLLLFIINIISPLMTS